MKSEKRILVYQLEDSNVYFDVRDYNGTVWITKDNMAKLFDTTVNNINYHINKVFEERNLNENPVSSILEHTDSGGKKHTIKHYNLYLIISVGDRLKSKRHARFQEWVIEIQKKITIESSNNFSIIKEFSKNNEDEISKLKEHVQNFQGNLDGIFQREDGTKYQDPSLSNAKIIFSNDNKPIGIEYRAIKHKKEFFFKLTGNEKKEEIFYVLTNFLDQILRDDSYRRGELSNFLQQPLFPIESPEKPHEMVKIKKDIICPVIGNIPKLKNILSDCLTTKLDSGKTVEQEIDEIKEWEDSLNLDQLSDFIVLVGYFQANKFHSTKEIDPVSRTPIHLYPIKLDANFFSLFIPEDELFEKKIIDGVQTLTRNIKSKIKQKKLKDIYEFSERQFLVPFNDSFIHLPFFKVVHPRNKKLQNKARIFAVHESFILTGLKENYYRIATDLKPKIKAEIERIKARDKIKKDIENTYHKYTIKITSKQSTDLMEFFYDVPLRLVRLLIQEYNRKKTHRGKTPTSGKYKDQAYYYNKTRDIPLKFLISECGSLDKRVNRVYRKYINKRSIEGSKMTNWEWEFMEYILSFSIKIIRELRYIHDDSEDFILRNKDKVPFKNVSFKLNPYKFDKVYIQEQQKLLT